MFFPCWVGVVFSSMFRYISSTLQHLSSPSEDCALDCLFLNIVNISVLTHTVIEDEPDIIILHFHLSLITSYCSFAVHHIASTILKNQFWISSLMLVAPLWTDCCRHPAPFWLPFKFDGEVRDSCNNGAKGSVIQTIGRDWRNCGHGHNRKGKATQIFSLKRDKDFSLEFRLNLILSFSCCRLSDKEDDDDDDYIIIITTTTKWVT